MLLVNLFESTNIQSGSIHSIYFLFHCPWLWKSIFLIHLACHFLVLAHTLCLVIHSCSSSTAFSHSWNLCLPLLPYISSLSIRLYFQIIHQFLCQYNKFHYQQICHNCSSAWPKNGNWPLFLSISTCYCHCCSNSFNQSCWWKTDSSIACTS